MTEGLRILLFSLAALLVLASGCSDDASDDDDDTTAGDDDDGPYSEIPLEATASYLDRQAEYLQYCHDNNGPDSGGMHGQVCRVYMGSEVYPDAIDSSCDKVDAREDCADFSMASMVRVLYLDRANGSLDPAVRTQLEEHVLGFKYWIDEPGVDQMCYWTENHQILYHSNELLAGQLFPDEVFSNTGMTGAEHVEHAETLAERWLDFRGQFGFSEWHSNVYFNEDVPAVVNLADFAEDETIRTKAAAVLDIVAFDLANNYYKGNFATVHGRTYESKFIDGLKDSTQEAAWIMLGLGTYESTGNFSGAFLATSERYWTPGMLEEIATATAPDHEHRQRDSIDVSEGPDWGVGYTDHDDVIFWAGMSALVAPEVAEGTFAMVDELDLWEGFLFGDIPDEILDLIELAMDAGTLQELATDLEPVTRGIALEGMDTYVFRTPDYQLAGAQNHKPAYWASQTQMWQATLDNEAYVFTSYPSNLANAGLDVELAGEWIGSWMPRGTFHHNVGVLQYRRQEVPLADAYISSDHTHAFFPRNRFDEIAEQGQWVFGRKDDGYVALYSQNPVSWSEDNDYELIAEGETNIWIVEMGRADDSGTFAEFTAAVGAASVAFGDTVVYESPSVGTVEVGWEGPMTVAGESVDLGPFPRWSNPYAEVEHGSKLTHIDLDDLRLELDFEGGRRRLLQLD
jgi:hypothetical protein